MNPIAGQELSLTCTINNEGETIQWVGPDGNVITPGGGISIADVSTTGNTASTLTIDNIADTQEGNYICRTTVVEDVMAPITVQGTTCAVTCCS